MTGKIPALLLVAAHLALAQGASKRVPCSTAFFEYDDMYNLVKIRYEFAKRLEALIIEKYPDRFRRERDTLSVSLLNGKARTHVDSDDGFWCPYTVIEYRAELEYVVLRWHAWGDDGAFTLLDRKTGQETNGLQGIPILSPDRKRFCAISVGSCYSRNEISIYGLPPADEMQFPEYRLDPDWAPVQAEWMDNDKIKIVGKPSTASNEEHISILTHKDKGWEIVTR